ncbi:unnamed protein product [Adineta ricciae]|uniref:Alpha-tubulin N-acetyltransferase n=1 Tax=Adineta ricciae TaxID=249248 RepID=A0A813T8Z7_ADIRI|nr:unnamed protein product [Adineta ricciae]CAF1243530.1 unnamed protein product [Adineta ricciae]
MEFPFDINQVLPLELTIINGDYRVLNPGESIRILALEKLTSIIDAMGDASFKAQGLYGPITTARKLRMSDHHLYIIKKSDDNNNKGSVVGILKVGPKHLYIYDTNGQVYERTPLCVLDFYVHESKQRLGYGKKLFDTMLSFEKCVPHELPVDRPSNKCLAFLHKHYNLSSPIHLVNNFVVYQGFFTQSVDANSKEKSSSLKEPVQSSTSWLVPSQRQHSSSQERNERLKRLVDENRLFDKREPVSYYSTSYDRHFNQNAAVQEIKHNAQSAKYTPRSYSQVFNQNHSNQHTSLTKSTTNQSQQRTTNSSSSTWRIFGIPQ